MKPPILPRIAIPAHSRGFSLVLTLVLLSGMTILVLGLFSMSTQELRTSRSYAQDYRAELAVESGYAAACQALAKQMNNDSFVVFNVPAPADPTKSVNYAAAADATGKWTYQPLFSGGQEPVFAVPKDTALQPVIPALQTGVVAGAPVTPAWIKPYAGYVTLSQNLLQPDGTPETIRQDGKSAHKTLKTDYTWWVEDLSGYVDGDMAGNNGFESTTGTPAVPNDPYALANRDPDEVPSETDSALHTRGGGLWPREISIYTLLPNFQNTNTDTTTIDNKFLWHRRKFLTPATINQCIQPGSESWRFLTAGEGEALSQKLSFGTQNDNEAAVIPYGFGYSEAGKAAYDLNELIKHTDAAEAAAKVIEIARIINTNLPKFKDRQGAFPTAAANTADKIDNFHGQDYVKTIAASIIDYADADNDATVKQDDTTGAGNYRGVDSIPWINKIVDRYAWTGNSSKTNTVEMTTFVELWNLSNITVKGGTLKCIVKNTQKLDVAGGYSFYDPSEGREYPEYTVTIPDMEPNKYLVVKLGTTVYTIDYSPVGSTSTKEVMRFVGGLTPQDGRGYSYDCSYTAYWNGQIVDGVRTYAGVKDDTGPGMQKQGSTLVHPSHPTSYTGPKYKGSGSPFLDTNEWQYGDPRATFYMRDSLFSHTYATNISWGGAKQGFGPSRVSWRGEVIFVAGWRA